MSVVVGSVYWCGPCDMYVGANRAKSACMDACTGDPRSTECYNPNPKTLWGDPSQYASGQHQPSPVAHASDSKIPEELTQNPLKSGA